MSTEAGDAVMRVIREINQTWTTGHVDEMESRLHPQITLAPPGFAARERGRERFVGGHRDFCDSATIHEFLEEDPQVDIVDDIAVATYRYALIYENAEGRFASTGRDLWVLHLKNGHWVAVWRTILDADETAA